MKQIETFPLHPALDVIQGGMGVRTSSYTLAGAVAHENGTGLISGTAIGTVLSRELNDGDPTGELRTVLADYPKLEIADAIIEKFYRKDGRSGAPYDRTPLFNYRYAAITADLAVVGAFAEVMRAKRRAGGNGLIGMNLLTKIEEPTIHTLYGAMQADVDLVAMGAGLPTQIPRYLQEMAEGRSIEFPISVTNASRAYALHFDPSRYAGNDQALNVPRFLTIVTSDILAKRLSGVEVPPDGFIIEEPIAGGHNAPPRSKNVHDERGQPVYSNRDYANLEKMNDLGIPYWLASGYGSREGLLRARSLGARGVQIGSLFALASESGLDPALRTRMIDTIRSGQDISVYTDALASPTGFPFKVAELDDTMSDPDVYASRERICDLGYLREAVEIDGKVAYRCASEPTADYVKKRGELSATIGRKCICNALLATIGMGQVRGETSERPIITIGDAVNENIRAMKGEVTAATIIQSLRGE